MKLTNLHTQLTNLTAHKKSRLEVSNWVIENPNHFKELLNFCFMVDKKISYKAAWTLEIVCEKQIELLVPHFDLFFKNISKVTKDQALRPLSKICLMLTQHYYKKNSQQVNHFLSNNYKEIMIECCFDWLITNQKVATEAYAMRSLYFLGTEIDWIHPELIIIIKQNIPNKTAAYKARGRMTLEEIEKYNRKTQNS